jgi:AraC-like DNA-binding protein
VNESDYPYIHASTIFRTGGLAAWQANRALKYIEGNLGSKMAIREIADYVALSKSHFSRAFKRSLGSSPIAYVTEKSRASAAHDDVHAEESDGNCAGVRIRRPATFQQIVSTCRRHEPRGLASHIYK